MKGLEGYPLEVSQKSAKMVKSLGSMILGVEGLEGSVHNDYIDSSDLISR